MALNTISNHCDIALILVNYYCDDEIIRFVDKIIKMELSIKIDIIVCCNASNNFKLLCQQLKDREVSVFKAPRNLGYLNGGDFALQEYSKNSGLPKWVILSNPDIEIDHSICRILSFDDEQFGMLAPQITSSKSKKDQNPFQINRPSKKKLYFLYAVYRYRYIASLYAILATKRDFLKPPALVAANSEIYAPHGSFMIFSTRFIRRMNGLSYPAFLFGEELFLAERLIASDLSCIYAPSIKVIHAENHTTQHIESQTFLDYKRESLGYLLSNFYK